MSVGSEPDPIAAHQHHPPQEAVAAAAPTPAAMMASLAAGAHGSSPPTPTDVEASLAGLVLADGLPSASSSGTVRADDDKAPLGVLAGEEEEDPTTPKYAAGTAFAPPPAAQPAPAEAEADVEDEEPPPNGNGRATPPLTDDATSVASTASGRQSPASDASSTWSVPAGGGAHAHHGGAAAMARGGAVYYARADEMAHVYAPPHSNPIPIPGSGNGHHPQYAAASPHGAYPLLVQQQRQAQVQAQAQAQAAAAAGYAMVYDGYPTPPPLAPQHLFHQAGTPPGFFVQGSPHLAGGQPLVFHNSPQSPPMAGFAAGGGMVVYLPKFAVPRDLWETILSRRVDDIQARSGAKITVNFHDMGPDMVSVGAMGAQWQVEYCQLLLQSYLCPAGDPDRRRRIFLQLEQFQPLQQRQMKVPSAQVGRLIGRHGATIRLVMADTNTLVDMPKELAYGLESLVLVTGLDLEAIEGCMELLRQRLIPDFVPSKQPEGIESVFIAVPDEHVGRIIGKKGNHIREVQDKSGARVFLPKECVPDRTERHVTVTGTKQQRDSCLGLLRRLMTPPNQSPAPLRFIQESLQPAPPFHYRHPYGTGTAYYPRQPQQHLHQDPQQPQFGAPVPMAYLPVQAPFVMAPQEYLLQQQAAQGAQPIQIQMQPSPPFQVGPVLVAGSSPQPGLPAAGEDAAVPLAATVNHEVVGRAQLDALCANNGQTLERLQSQFAIAINFQLTGQDRGMLEMCGPAHQIAQCIEAVGQLAVGDHEEFEDPTTPVPHVPPQPDASVEEASAEPETVATG